MITYSIPAHEVVEGTVINDPRFLTRKAVRTASVNLTHSIVRLDYTDGSASSHAIGDTLYVVEGV